MFVRIGVVKVFYHAAEWQGACEDSVNRGLFAAAALVRHGQEDAPTMAWIAVQYDIMLFKQPPQL